MFICCLLSPTSIGSSPYHPIQSRSRDNCNREIGDLGWSNTGTWVFLGGSSCLGGEGEETAIDRGTSIDMLYSEQDAVAIRKKKASC